MARPTGPAAPSLAALLAALLLLSLLGGAATAGATTSAGLRLEVWDREAGRAVHTRAVAVGERFELRHTHSVTRRPVIETFSVAGPEGIAIEELWFDEFGPNLPAGPERIGDTTTTFRHEPGGFRVLHHGRLLPTLPVLAGSPGVDHVVWFADGTRVRLLDLVRPAAPVELVIVD